MQSPNEEIEEEVIDDTVSLDAPGIWDAFEKALINKFKHKGDEPYETDPNVFYLQVPIHRDEARFMVAQMARSLGFEVRSKLAGEYSGGEE